MKENGKYLSSLQPSKVHYLLMSTANLILPYRTESKVNMLERDEPAALMVLFLYKKELRDALNKPIHLVSYSWLSQLFQC